MVKFDYDEKYRKGRLICENPIFSMVRNHFSMAVEEAQYINKMLRMKGKSYTVPSRKYVIGESGLFDFGMYDDIQKYLVSEQILEIEFTKAFEDRRTAGLGLHSVSDGLCHKLRDYQAETVSTALEMGCGTIVIGTGGGKSLIQASILENWFEYNPEFKALVVVPGLSLVSQLTKDFETYKVSFTFSGWTGETPLQDTQVVITNSENLWSQFDKHSWITGVDVYLNDECHRVKSDSLISKIIYKVKTPNKFGFTGTLPKSDFDKWKIIGTFGPVIYEKSSKELRDEGYLSNVLVKAVELQHPKKRMNYPKELEYIHNNEGRNKFIVDLVTKLNKNVLVLVNRIEHGENLLKEFQSRNHQEKWAWFISGEMPVEDREAITSKMEVNNNIVCFAMSSIFSTGINIRNLPFILFVDGGKSFIRIVQSVGRGLRLHEQKDKLIIFDISDNLKYSSRHAEKRRKFYDDEQIEWTESKMKLHSIC